MMFVPGWTSDVFLPCLMVIIIQASFSEAVFEVPGFTFATAGQMVNKDISNPAAQYGLNSSLRLTLADCASICVTNPSCDGFSLKTKNGSTEGAVCSISSNASKVVDAPVTGDGYQSTAFMNTDLLGADGSFPPFNINQPCLRSVQCINGTACLQGYCRCPAGFLAFNGNGACIPEPPVDSSGFQQMSDGYSYKRVPVSPTSLNHARSTCSGQGGTLPVPYGIPGVGARAQEALRTFMRPGEEIYIGVVRTGAYTLRTFLADGGAVNFTATTGNLSQFWAPGEPNANSNAEADAVTMTLLEGWMDKPSTTQVNALICCKTNYTYQAATGKYYRMYRNLLPRLSHLQSAQLCQSEGAGLAITRGPNGRTIFQTYWILSAPSEFFVDGIRIGTTDTWEFRDGVTQVYTLTSNRDNWAVDRPGTTGSCILCCWSAGELWGSENCATTLSVVLCERSYP